MLTSQLFHETIFVGLCFIDWFTLYCVQQGCNWLNIKLILHAITFNTHFCYHSVR